MGCEAPGLRFFLDEHYPGWLATDLRARGIDAVALVADVIELRGEDDTTVLKAAVADDRVVVTEDVRTFGVAAGQVENHRGIVFVSQRRFPRTRPGLTAIRGLADDSGAG